MIILDRNQFFMKIELFSFIEKDFLRALRKNKRKTDFHCFENRRLPASSEYATFLPLRYPLFLVCLLASLPIFRSSVPSDIPDALYRFSSACLAPSSLCRSFYRFSCLRTRRAANCKSAYRDPRSKNTINLITCSGTSFLSFIVP